MRAGATDEPASSAECRPAARTAHEGPGGASPLVAAPSAGHRLVPHAGDFVIESWGTDRVSCLSEALAGLVDEVADVTLGLATETRALAVRPGQLEDLLVSLLEEVIYTIDVLSVVPVRFRLRETAEGGISGEMDVVPVRRVRIVGPSPKAVTYHGLTVSEREGGCTCRVLIDV